jgi:hydrogenase maturation protease
MSLSTARCLILACGNTLRGDDGIGPWLAEWAEERFSGQSDVRVISRQQWTPELAEEIAGAESVLFVDCSVESAAGTVKTINVEPANPEEGLATHHIGAPQLLQLAKELYGSLPRTSLLLTVGAGSIELSEEFSAEVTASQPEACRQIEEFVLGFLKNPRQVTATSQNNL